MQAEIGIGIDGDGDGAAKLGQVVVHDEVGVEEEDFVARVEGGEEGEEKAGGGAGKDEDGGIVPAGFLDGSALEGCDEFGDALRGGVAVLAGADGVDGFFLEEVGDIEIRLADREVDGVLELRGQVEDLADAGGVDGAGMVGDHGGGVEGHGFLDSFFQAEGRSRLKAGLPNCRRDYRPVRTPAPAGILTALSGRHQPRKIPAIMDDTTGPVTVNEYKSLLLLLLLGGTVALAIYVGLHTQPPPSPKPSAGKPVPAALHR